MKGFKDFVMRGNLVELAVAFVVYFFVVKPYEAARRRFVRQEDDAAPAEDVQVLKEIRDLLAGRPTV